MRQVAIVTDSSCDVPAQLIANLDIKVIPLTLTLGGQAYRDGLDISYEDIVPLLDGNHRITVSLPAVGEFVTAYRQALQRGLKVVSIHVSRLLSGTYQSAQIAANAVDPEAITIIDSGMGTMALGWQVIYAARAAEKGKRPKDIIDVCREVRDNTALVFALGDLSYLHRIGRIGWATAWVATKLHARALLSCRDGVIKPIARIRGHRRVVPTIIELCCCDWPAGTTIDAAVMYTVDDAPARQLLAELRAVYDVRDSYLLPMGPVVTAGIGPNAVGVTFDFPVARSAFGQGAR